MRPQFMLPAFALLWTLCPPAVGAQQDLCDPKIRSIAGGAQPYRSRGDRCEGTYKQPIGAGLYLRSIYQSFGDFNLTSTRDPLVIGWDPPPGRGVTLRADGWVGEEPYRMDALPLPGSRSFTWDVRYLRILSAGSLQPVTRRDLGIQAWIDSAGAILYVPVRIRQGQSPDRCGTVKLVLWANSRPDSVFVEVETLRSGQTGQSFGRRKLAQQRYPLNGPFTFELPEIQSPGIYQVKVSAQLGSNPWPRQYLIYVADDARIACA